MGISIGAMSDDRFFDAPVVPSPDVARRIEAVAFELFEQNGFAQVTVDELAAAAAMSVETYASHFETKVDSVLGVQLEFLHRTADRVATLSVDDFSLTAIEDAVLDVLAAGDSDNAAVGSRMLRLRSLIVTDADFRAAAAAHIITQTNPFDAWAANLPADRGGSILDKRVTIEIAAGTLRAAFDVWAVETAGGSDCTLADVYRESIAISRRITR
jgi:AcrR family transcriptional regulator